MRRTALAPVLLLFAAPALAQPVQSLARVKVGSASVYSGPGEQMPKCGTVEQGYVVVVDHPEGGDWLAVQPPNGSLSWISHLHVNLQAPAEGRDPFPANAVVHADGEVKLAVGQYGTARPLGVRRTKIPDGTVVKVVGPKVRATAEGDTGESSWYPIIPPRDDFRYVRRADVEMIGGSEKPGFVVKTAKPGDQPGGSGDLPVAPIPGGSGDFRPAPGGSDLAGDGPNHPLWRDAEKARLAGNFPQAEKWYKQLAEEATKAGETALANLCFSRIHSLRELQRQKDRGEPAAKPLPLDTGAVPGGTAKKPAAATVGGTGQVRVVAFKFEGRQVYALTDRRGVSLYVVSDDLDMSRYVGRWVELSGAVGYPKEFGGTGLMTATAVEKVEGK